jgi:hypothetical protein
MKWDREYQQACRYKRVHNKRLLTAVAMTTRPFLFLERRRRKF